MPITVPGRQRLAKTPCTSTVSSFRYWPWLRFSQCSPPSVERIAPPTSIAPYNISGSLALASSISTRFAGLAPGAVAAVDLAILAADEDHVGIVRMEQDRPHRQAVVGHLNLFPMLTAIGAA